MNITEPILGEYIVPDKITGQQAVIRREISLNMPHQVGIQISDGKTLVDPTDIIAKVYKRDDFSPNADPQGTLAVTFPHGALTKESTGVYSFPISSVFTQNKGLLNVVWEYSINNSSIPNTYKEFFAVNEYMPTFNALNAGEQGIVERVLNRFADLYDSQEGGPHLKMEFQTHFSYERIAQLMSVAVNNINFGGTPVTSFIVGAGPGRHFPVKGYGILERGLYIEVIKHLIRSYTEQPAIQSEPGVAYGDRRDYTDRWKAVLDLETGDFKDNLKFYKRSLLGLGGGNLLVAGGIYGTMYGAAANANGAYTAALRTIGRYYPVSFVVSLPGNGS